MASAKEHYDNFLAEHYTWMFGDYASKVQENRDFFERNGIEPRLGGKALDLGCGAGFQSVALAELGFEVLGLDLCETLLEELQGHIGDRKIELVQGDMVDYTIFAARGPFEVVVCMGDTITHLEKVQDVWLLFERIYDSLEGSGTLALTYRDLTSEPKGIDRLVPVRSDNDKIMATFLEYEEYHVNVHDMIFIRRDTGWELKKSVFKKLRISSDEIMGFLQGLGFRIKSSEVERSFFSIVAQK